jgi:hypothetical protein
MVSDLIALRKIAIYVGQSEAARSPSVKFRKVHRPHAKASCHTYCALHFLSFLLSSFTSRLHRLHVPRYDHLPRKHDAFISPRFDVWNTLSHVSQHSHINLDRLDSIAIFYICLQYCQCLCFLVSQSRINPECVITKYEELEASLRYRPGSPTSRYSKVTVTSRSSSRYSMLFLLKTQQRHYTTTMAVRNTEHQSTWRGSRSPKTTRNTEPIRKSLEAVSSTETVREGLQSCSRKKKNPGERP